MVMLIVVAKIDVFQNDYTLFLTITIAIIIIKNLLCVEYASQFNTNRNSEMSHVLGEVVFLAMFRTLPMGPWQ